MGEAMMKVQIGTLLAAAASVCLLGLSAASADPLGGKEPWNFTPTNRLSAAVVIKNVEDGKGTGGAGSGGGTTVVCGGTSGGSGDHSNGAGSSATANNTCIVVNNSNGAIVDVDQDSNGNQSSNANANSQSSSTTTTNNSASAHNGRPTGSIDEVSAILSGRGQ
jgi:hypothetical protein